MLTDEHNLYGCHFTEDNQPDMTTLELWFQGVKDILVDGTNYGTLSVLFDDGSYNRYNVLEMGGPYQPDPIQEVAAISYDSILLKDGTVRYYRIDYAPEKTAEEYLSDYGIKPGEYQIYMETEEHSDSAEGVYLLLRLPARVMDQSLTISRALGYQLGVDVRIETYGKDAG